MSSGSERVRRAEWGLSIGVVLAASLVLVWSARSARALERSLPVLVRQGTDLSGLSAEIRPRTEPEDPQESAARGPLAPEDLERADDGSLRVPMEEFTFPTYDPPELRPDPSPLAPAAFPPLIGALDGRRIEVEGYPIVGAIQGDRVEAFLVARFPPGCCFGSLPVVDEWLDVAPEGGGTDARLVPSWTVRVRGVLEIGEEIDEFGSLLSLYRLKDATVVSD